MVEPELSPEEFSDALFKAYFPIPHVPYDPDMLSTASAADQNAWQQFIQETVKFQTEIKTVIVPLAFDHKHGFYWADYHIPLWNISA
jgi:hypothetical protein